MKKNLTRPERLSAASDIATLFRVGSHVRTQGMHLRYRSNGQSHHRVMFATTRKFRGAVQRNHARRLAREAYRLNKPAHSQRYDLAFILYPGEYSASERTYQLRELLRSAQLDPALT